MICIYLCQFVFEKSRHYLIPSCFQKQKDLLKKLYAWRFRQAKTKNCAIFMFLPDEGLFSLVQNVENIKEILSPEKFKLYGEQLELIISKTRS